MPFCTLQVLQSFHTSKCQNAAIPSQTTGLDHYEGVGAFVLRHSYLQKINRCDMKL